MINREYLDEIINNSKDYENWWKPDLFEKEIKPLLPKELEIITPPPNRLENYIGNTKNLTSFRKIIKLYPYIAYQYFRQIKTIRTRRIPSSA